MEVGLSRLIQHNSSLHQGPAGDQRVPGGGLQAKLTSIESVADCLVDLCAQRARSAKKMPPDQSTQTSALKFRQCYSAG